jgi:membrane-associated protease RseP (regulator of RpoE activity)
MIRRLAPQLGHGAVALALFGLITLSLGLVGYSGEQNPIAVPEMVDGKMIGFRFNRLQPDSASATAGMRSGDILVEIDGTALTDTAMTIRIMQATRGKPSIPVVVLRDGKRLRFELPAEEPKRTLK